MPTETFYNLPQEKRQKLIAAIKQELSRVPLHDASINRIVRDAGISRGSYYQYFRDRDDLFAFLIQDYSQAMQRCAREALIRSRGDLFQTLMAGFDESIRFSRCRADAAVFMSLFSYHGMEEGAATDDLIAASLGRLITDNLDLIDQSRLRHRGRDDLMHTLEILVAILRGALFELFHNPSGAEALRAQFQRKLEIVQTGMCLADASAERSSTC